MSDNLAEHLDHRETNRLVDRGKENLITERDTRSTKGMTTQDEIRRNHRGSDRLTDKSDPALWRKDAERLKSHRSTKDSINLTISFNAGEYISNIPNAELQTHRLSDNENCFPYNKYRGSSRAPLSRRTSVSLPAISASLDLSLVEGKTSKSQSDIYRDSATACNDEEETLFNRPSETKAPPCSSRHSTNENTIDNHRCNSSKREHDNNIEEEIAASSARIGLSCENLIDPQLRTRNNEIVRERDEDTTDLCKENGSFSTAALNARTRNNTAFRPTLADDSKLVKLSILTTPMNIMQSNVQLLNKSRNFLNFITEKSTNIMEKALLPQHLTMRYNHVTKSTEANATGMFINNESSLRDVAYRSNADLITNSNGTLDVTDCTVKQNQNDNGSKNKPANAINSENEVNSSARVKKNKTHDFENESALNEDKYCIFEKSETDKLDCQLETIDGRAKLDLSLAEINEDKNNCLQAEQLYNEIHKKENLSDICTLVDSDISKYGALEHPLYLMLLQDYTSLKRENSKLLERLERSNQSNKLFKEIQTNTEASSVQVQNLKKTVNKLVADLNASLITQESLKNECSTVNKEKENMVMKYVISEKQLIDSQRVIDSTERKVKELLKDQELLQTKLRQSQSERTRICNILDGKCHEITELQKEMDKLREDVKLKEVKLKWTQNKLKTEMDMQKDTQQKLDKALMKINDMKEECEQIRRETQESFRKFQQSEENRAVTLDQQLKEHQARLILERHVTEDKEMLRLQLQKELETLKSRQQDVIEENKRLSLKIQESEKTRLDCENNLSDLKISLNQHQDQVTELLIKVSHLETLKLQLQHKEEYIALAESQIQELRSVNEELRSVNEELQSDMQACRKKEADMLDFTQKLTDKNVRVQSELITIQTKVNHLESEHGPLRDCISELTNKVRTLEENLRQEQRKREEECEILAKHVAEQTQLAQNLAQELEDSQGENAVFKRKHQISMKELTRELQQCRRRLEIFETASPSNSLDVTSRTGSNTSLNTGDTLNGALSDNNANSDHIQSIEPSRQVLMDHIVKLQNKYLKRAEKLDFLEEHTQTLVEELKKKTKLIQYYLVHQNFGALGCNERDRHKAELARHGGIMASVYNHRVSDENMTLELSLEINQKLQAVLEDALLKNITLKDNIDTLGNEIARLTIQHQERQIEN